MTLPVILIDEKFYTLKQIISTIRSLFLYSTIFTCVSNVALITFTRWLAQFVRSGLLYNFIRFNSICHRSLDGLPFVSANHLDTLQLEFSPSLIRFSLIRIWAHHVRVFEKTISICMFMGWIWRQHTKIVRYSVLAHSLHEWIVEREIIIGAVPNAKCSNWLYQIKKMAKMYNTHIQKNKLKQMTEESSEQKKLWRPFQRLIKIEWQCSFS